jgi:hypothetical protein
MFDNTTYKVTFRAKTRRSKWHGDAVEVGLQPGTLFRDYFTFRIKPADNRTLSYPNDC